MDLTNTRSSSSTTVGLETAAHRKDHIGGHSYLAGWTRLRIVPVAQAGWRMMSSFCSTTLVGQVPSKFMLSVHQSALVFCTLPNKSSIGRCRSARYIYSSRLYSLSPTVKASMGGMIALELASKIAPRIISLSLLVSSAGGFGLSRFTPMRGVIGLLR